MNLEHLTELITVLLALSLATERLVMIIRTPLGFMNNENPDSRKDSPRRFMVQVLAFGCALTTSYLFANLQWSVDIGGSGYNVILLALLAMGGSSFWKNILGFTKAMRDSRREHLGQLGQQQTSGTAAAAAQGNG